MKNSDVKLGIVIIFFSLTGLLYIYQANYVSTIGLSPGFFPMFIMIVMGLCGGGILFTALKNGGDDAPGVSFNIKRTAPVVLLLAVYVFVLEHIGFVISTFLFMLLCMIFYGERRKSLLALVPVVTSAAVYLIFTRLFSVPLP